MQLKVKVNNPSVKIEDMFNGGIIVMKILSVEVNNKVEINKDRVENK